MNCITLTTDFGTDSTYVASLKGSILSRNPDVNIVDVSHGIPPQDVRKGALVLADVYQTFPPSTIHLAVIDPGVGSERRILVAEIDAHYFIAPDNGLLSAITSITSPTKVHLLSNLEICAKEISTTFHGRDIFAPIAAYLSLGKNITEVGPSASEILMLDWPEVIVRNGHISGEIESIDSFGNLITNITQEHLQNISNQGYLTIKCGEHQVKGISKFYAENSDSAIIALLNSNKHLELAIVNGNAAKELGISTGDAVSLLW